MSDLGNDFGPARYWGGPYDGEIVDSDDALPGFKGEARPPIKNANDAAGNLVVNPLGSYERYVRVAYAPNGYAYIADRYEWRGTHMPGRVDA